MAGKGKVEMFSPEFGYRLIAERQAQWRYEADRRRQLGDRQARRSVRRSVGRSLIQIGQRLAADGQFKPAAPA